MDFTTFLIIIAVFYGVLLFFDNFFKTCAHYPYIQFLKNTGFEINLFRIKWNTLFFNRIVLRLGSSRTRMLYYWFDIGMYISLLLLPVAVILLLYANYQLFFSANHVSSPTSNNQNRPVLEPMIPGVNLPITEIGYFAFALLITSIIHEFGHALAAVKEDVHLIDTGIYLFVCLPIAFVNISTEKLSTISQWRGLRIFCAGIWHNIVLMLITGLLYLSLPIMLNPLYETNSGVIVTHVKSNSHLSGPRGLHVNDKITRINNCIVIDTDSWERCLSSTRTEKPGFCVNTDLVHELDESGPFVQLANGAWDCCAPNSATHLCFEYLEETGGVVELPQHMCLPGRRIVDESKGFCYVENRRCIKPFHCVKPLLNNVTSLIVFSCDHNNNNKQNVIYIGHPADVFTTVEVSPYIPKFKLFGTNFANIIDKSLKYVTVFSAGVALINILPCLFFDGQHITNSLAIVLLKNKFKIHTVTVVSGIITILGTFMLFINFFKYLWNFFKM